MSSMSLMDEAKNVDMWSVTCHLSIIFKLRDSLMSGVGSPLSTSFSGIEREWWSNRRNRYNQLTFTLNYKNKFCPFRSSNAVENLRESWNFGKNRINLNLQTNPNISCLSWWQSSTDWNVLNESDKGSSDITPSGLNKGVWKNFWVLKYICTFVFVELFQKLLV